MASARAFAPVAPLISRSIRPTPSPHSLRTALKPLLQQPNYKHDRPSAQSPQSQTRHSSHSPLGNPLGPSRKPVTLPTIASLYRARTPITMLTAHDFPSAMLASHAGIDMLLVGDSLAMVTLGMANTSQLTLDEMLIFCRAVHRASPSCFTVGDLPMGCYEVSPEQALASSIRVVKEGRMQAVKLEGGREMAATVARIASAGIPVLGHIGLTPQRQNALGGFRVQGKTGPAAAGLLADARALEAAGAFAVVLEAVPAEVAAAITGKLGVPTIGIGAGPGTSGQVLVQMDMLGNFPPGRFMPRFVKRYGDVWGESIAAVERYRDEVRAGTYPAEEHTYPVKEEQLVEIRGALEQE